MTQEEKAKAYDKALEKARQLCAYPTSKPFISDLQDLFPDLAESEDEKIRKALLEHCRKQAEMYNTLQTAKEYNKVQSWIAWLEKQGEKSANKVEPKFRIGDVIEVKPMKCHGKIFTGKPNKIVDITEKSYIFDDGKAYSIELQDGWKLSEQNPAWSKKDEDMLDDLICYFDKSLGLRHLLFEVATWLKSLKDRVQPQPKQEWSEWDRILQDSSISYLCNLRDTFETKGWDKEQIIKCINWLQSLRPQNKWKPSELQLECLDDAIKHYNSRGYDALTLKELLNELKKLREEQL